MIRIIIIKNNSESTICLKNLKLCSVQFFKKKHTDDVIWKHVWIWNTMLNEIVHTFLNVWVLNNLVIITHFPPNVINIQLLPLISEVGSTDLKTWWNLKHSRSGFLIHLYAGTRDLENIVLNIIFNSLH